MNLGNSGQFTDKEVEKTVEALDASGLSRFSISLIQRKMRFGFNKSANILQKLVDSGVLIKNVEDKTGYKFTNLYINQR